MTNFWGGGGFKSDGVDDWRKERHKVEALNGCPSRLPKGDP